MPYLVEIIEFLWFDNPAKECASLKVLSWTKAHGNEVDFTVA